MRGDDLPIKEALIRLAVLRRIGKSVQARFRCEYCKTVNEVPLDGEGASVIECGTCLQVNYLDMYQIVSYEL